MITHGDRVVPQLTMTVADRIIVSQTIIIN